ncbi:MAG: apolipoprotein N-acyltransferase [Candidatus Hydrogenedentota bacterium]
MKTSLEKYGLPLMSGLILAFCFPTWHLYFLAWVALAPLFYACRQATPKEAAKRFFLAGWVFHSVLLQWMLTNFYWAGGWAFWGQQAVCVIMAAYWALTGMLWVWSRRRLLWLPPALSLMVLWMAMEYAQGRLFTGFGWSSLGYSQGKDLAFLQLAALGGTNLLAGILVAFNVLMAETIYSRRLRAARLTIALVILVGVHGGGLLLLSPAAYPPSSFRVGLFQSNFPLEMKWDPEYTVEMVHNAVEKSRKLAEEEPVDLFVWPETLVMGEFMTPEILGAVTELTQSTGTALFTGSQRIDSETSRFRNSSFLVTKKGKIQGHYDKIHLAPFGEYVPFGSYFPIIQTIVPAISDIEPGDTARVFPIEDRALGPLICFEVLFPDMSETLRRKRADFLVVITNLGWFGASNALEQELEQARLRAVETRLPLVHSANTGISGVFDPWGRFMGMNAIVTSYGTLHWLKDDVSPYATKRFRSLGAMPLAKAGKRPVPWAPQRVPQAAVLASGILLLAGLVTKLRTETAP